MDLRIAPLMEVVRFTPQSVSARLGGEPDTSRARSAYRRFEAARDAHFGKTTQAKRAELRLEIETARDAFFAEISALPNAERIVVRAVAFIGLKIKEVGKIDARLAELEGASGLRAADLREALKGIEASRASPGWHFLRARQRLAKRIGIAEQALDDFERELRHLLRARKKTLEALGLPPDQMHGRLSLLRLKELYKGAVARRRRTRREHAIRVGAKAAAEGEQILEIVDREPRRGRRDPGERRSQIRPPLVAQRSETDREDTGDEEAVASEIGARGERLVFEQLVAPAWRSILRDEKARGVDLLRRISDAYWNLSAGELKQLLVAANASLLLADGGLPDLLRGLVWPASTEYGDAVGFDMIRPTTGLDWECVEVKSTAGPSGLSFVLTRNEWSTAQHEHKRYSVYRVGRIFESTPEVRILSNVRDLVGRGTMALSPIRYEVRLTGAAPAEHQHTLEPASGR